MRATDDDTLEAQALPCRVLICIRVVPERSLTVIGKSTQEKIPPFAYIFSFEKRGADTYLGLLGSEKHAHTPPLDIAINLLHRETGLRLPGERFEQDTRWITSEEGNSFWEYLYFADVYESEKSAILLDLPKRKLHFAQMAQEEVLSLLYNAMRGHALRLKHSRWFSSKNMQRAA